jgi:hypothetical protein
MEILKIFWSAMHAQKALSRMGEGTIFDFFRENPNGALVQRTCANKSSG